MSKKSDEPVWSLVMFDLPVLTKVQRRQATQFRKYLLDLGYQMAQLSVYVRYSPSTQSLVPTVNKIKRNVPPGGEVRILTITDHQWVKALRFVNDESVEPADVPQQLLIF